MIRASRFMASVCLILGIATLGTAAAQAPDSLSTEAARQLSRLMAEHQLDAIAAADPDQPDRFMAALHYPGAQLLVVSASYPVPDQLRQRLADRQFREAYTDLQGAGLRAGKFFVMDLGADGLRRTRESGQPFDIVYVDGVDSLQYDGNWADQKMTESQYNERFAADDVRYARILRLLATAVRPSSSSDATSNE